MKMYYYNTNILFGSLGEQEEVRRLGRPEVLRKLIY